MIQALIFPLALIMAIVMIAFQAVPNYNSAKEIKNTKIEQAEKQLQEENEIDRILEVLKQTYSEEESRLQSLFVALPADAKIEEVLIKLENLFDKHQLIYEGVSINDDSSGGSRNQNAKMDINEVDSIQFSTEVVGSYESIKSFLEDLQKLDRVSNLNLLTLEFQSRSGEGEASINFMSAELEFEFYKKDVIEPSAVKGILNTAGGTATGSSSASGASNTVSN
ncbi:MAG: type 4a pilus biogenesis protein PilO [Candidatus Moranbacteria bacterium]|nr:type 4a pilus biogenesis protein PilO [Candidatus Moranbacteria bacterium]